MTFYKLIPQFLASTLAGVGAGECGASLAYTLIRHKSSENGSITDALHHYMYEVVDREVT